MNIFYGPQWCCENISKPILRAAVADVCIGQKSGYQCQHMTWNLSEPAANRPVSTQRAVWNHRTCRDMRWKALSRVNSWDVLHFLVWFSFAWIQVSETERWWCSFHRILILFMFHWTCLCTTEPIHCMLGQNVDKKCFKSFWWKVRQLSVFRACSPMRSRRPPNLCQTEQCKLYINMSAYLLDFIDNMWEYVADN